MFGIYEVTLSYITHSVYKNPTKLFPGNAVVKGPDVGCVSCQLSPVGDYTINNYLINYIKSVYLCYALRTPRASLLFSHTMSHKMCIMRPFSRCEPLSDDEEIWITHFTRLLCVIWNVHITMTPLLRTLWKLLGSKTSNEGFIIR